MKTVQRGIELDSEQSIKEKVATFQKWLLVKEPFTKEQENQIFLCLEVCRGMEKAEAIQENINHLQSILILKNRNLVIKVVNKIIMSVTTNLTNKELSQAGNIGLWRAIKRFDYKQNQCFSSFAYEAVMWAVYSELRTVPGSYSNQKKLLSHRRGYSRLVERLKKELGRQPDIQEIIEGLNETNGSRLEVNPVVFYEYIDDHPDEVQSELSLDYSSDEFHLTPERYTHKKIVREEVLMAISSLSKQQKKAILLGFDFFLGDKKGHLGSGMKKGNFYFHRTNAIDKLRESLSYLKFAY